MAIVNCQWECGGLGGSWSRYGRFGFVGRVGRFEAWIHDQVEDVGGPDPAGFALEDGLAEALAVDDTAKVKQVQRPAPSGYCLADGRLGGMNAVGRRIGDDRMGWEFRIAGPLKPGDHFA